MTTFRDLPTRAQSLLAESSQHELRHLEITETDEIVVIEGRVTTFYLKQMAQEVVKPAADGRRLLNRVAVEN